MAQTATAGTRGPAVWLDMDQQELDDAYDQAVYAPNREQVHHRRHFNSARARAALGEPLRFAYGPTEFEGIDVYCTRRAHAPVAVYAHGGAWKKRPFSRVRIPCRDVRERGRSSRRARLRQRRRRRRQPDGDGQTGPCRHRLGVQETPASSAAIRISFMSAGTHPAGTLPVSLPPPTGARISGCRRMS